MDRDLDLRLGKQRLTLGIRRRTVVLCDNTSHAQRVAKAFADGGSLVIDGNDAPRGTVRDQLGRRADQESIDRVRSALHLEDSVLDWRPRELGALQRMLAASFVAIVQSAPVLVFDLAVISASPFDVAHLFGHLRRIAASFDCAVIAVVADAAHITSGGDYLVVMAGDAVAEVGVTTEVLTHPGSETLLRRLEATPIASPLAMQMRRVQRAATRPVNYAHTQIIVLPTQDSVALAGGEEEQAG